MLMTQSIVEAGIKHMRNAESRYWCTWPKEILQAGPFQVPSTRSMLHGSMNGIVCMLQCKERSLVPQDASVSNRPSQGN